MSPSTMPTPSHNGGRPVPDFARWDRYLEFRPAAGVANEGGKCEGGGGKGGGGEVEGEGGVGDGCGGDGAGGGLLGNRGVLDRTAGDLVVMTANPGGKMQPYNRAGRFIPECRLPYSTVLVESGVADIVVHPETG